MKEPLEFDQDNQVGWILDREAEWQLIFSLIFQKEELSLSGIKTMRLLVEIHRTFNLEIAKLLILNKVLVFDKEIGVNAALTDAYALAHHLECHRSAQERLCRPREGKPLKGTRSLMPTEDLTDIARAFWTYGQTSLSFPSCPNYPATSEL